MPEKRKDWLKETDNNVLAEDFRILAGNYALEKSNVKGGEIVETVTGLVKRILELGEVTFHTEQMKSDSLELLREALARIIRGGPYLDPPYGELIWTGKKKAIIGNARTDDLMRMGILTSGNLAYGFLRCYESEEIDRDEFEKRVAEHRVVESGEFQKFYYYKIREFIPFDEPKTIEVRRQVESVRFFESTFLPKDWDLQKLSNIEIIKLHTEIHGEAAEFSQKTGKPPGEGIIDRHTLIIEEMRRRKLEHRPATELDRLSQKFVTETKDNLDDKVKLSELMNLWQDGFAVRNPFLSFIGSSVVSGWGKDIDIHINHPSSDTKFLDAINFRLQSFLPPKMKDKIHLVSDYSGPFTNYVPFAILKIEMIPPEERKLIKMSMMKEGISELAESILREQRISDITRKSQASMSRKEDSLKLFRFFIQPKGIAGYKKEEAYSIESAVERVNQKWMKDDKFPIVHVEQKLDGMRVQIHSDGDKVKIWSEDGSDVTNRFPSIVKEVKEQGVSFVTDTEITGEKNGEHIGRSDVSGYAHAKTPVDDSPFTANVFDAPYLSEDIHKKSLQERKEAIKKLNSGKSFKRAGYKIAGSEKELKNAMSHFAGIKGSEGAILKKGDSIYPLSGMTGDWMKFKKEADIDAEVIEIHRVKGTDTYNYLCVIRDGVKRVPIGRTYNVRFEKNGKSIRVPIGGIIRIAFVNLNKYTDPGTGEVWFNWLTPRPVEYLGDKSRPGTVDMANKIVKATGGEIDEKRYPKRYEVALEKLKESVGVRDYEDWLAESFPLLNDLDEYEERLVESFGEEFVNEERKRNIKECGELNLFWDDCISEDNIVESEKSMGTFRNLSPGSQNIQEQLKDVPPKGSTKDSLWEHHWRGESVHADHRFKVNEHLNGVTIADSPGPGEVAKAKKTLSIEDDIDTAEKAKKIDDHFYNNKLWKFDPRMPEKKVLAFLKARQPVAWLRFAGKVDPGEVGATAEGPGFLYHVEKGHEKRFGTQKTYFKEYFESGKKYKGRWILRKIPSRKEWEKVGKGKLVWMAWWAKEDYENQIPYLLTRRGRTKRDYVPPEGQSGLSKEWEEKVPAEFQWWKKGLEKKDRLNMMDRAFNWFVENVEEFPFGKLKIKESVKDVKWTLSKAWWKGSTVVRGMPRIHFELFFDFGDKKLQRFDTESNPIFEEEVAGIMTTETTKPDGDIKDWLTFEDEIPAEHPKNPNEKIPVNYEIEDSGMARLIEKTENSIHLRFKGKFLKGLKMLVREDPKSEIWIFKKSV